MDCMPSGLPYTEQDPSTARRQSGSPASADAGCRSAVVPPLYRPCGKQAFISSSIYLSPCVHWWSFLRKMYTPDMPVWIRVNVKFFIYWESKQTYCMDVVRFNIMCVQQRLRNIKFDFRKLTIPLLTWSSPESLKQNVCKKKLESESTYVARPTTQPVSYFMRHYPPLSVPEAIISICKQNWFIIFAFHKFSSW